MPPLQRRKAVKYLLGVVYGSRIGCGGAFVGAHLALQAIGVRFGGLHAPFQVVELGLARLKRLRLAAQPLRFAAALGGLGRDVGDTRARVGEAAFILRPLRRLFAMQADCRAVVPHIRMDGGTARLCAIRKPLIIR